MDKFNKILKNVLIFLVIFLALNYLFKGCDNKQDETTIPSDKITFITTETEYSRRKTVAVEIVNNTKNTVSIPNECPNEPFKVLHFENNEWVEKTASPALKCVDTTAKTLKSTEKITISYSNWNHALFSEMGRFKIEAQLKVVSGDMETTETYTSNEFTVVEEGLFSKLWTGIFYRPIYNGLIFLISVMPFHDLGLAIILLTIIIRTILLLPSHKAMRSQKKMQEVQPRLEKIKEKYKGDQQKIAAETMAIWKEAKVNPFGSCLPLLLQFPFLIALFYAIQDGLNPDNAYLFYASYGNFSFESINVNFLGILDLTQRNLYVLPLIIGGLQFLQMKLSFARKAKKDQHKDGDKDAKPKNEMAIANSMMTYIMPVMIAVFTASLPAGVGLYWGVSTIYGIIQQVVINKEGPTDKDEPTVKVITTN